MPLTQEKRLDNNFSNNNDHSYLHKKFKKMASTIAAFPPSPPKVGELMQKETNVTQTNSNTAISNGSISAAHPEIEKIKDIPSVDNGGLEKNVQINFNNDFRLKNLDNIQISGQTSYTEEFSNKTENLENELIRDATNGGTSGRYICPYCKLSCAKPSVLQKHIRAHTNERPYPCIPCGFAFKTKSNLYKHRRSRTHALRLLGADVSASMNDEDMSGGSESDTSSPSMVAHDTGSDTLIIRNENSRPNEFSSPELPNDTIAFSGTSITLNDSKSKTIYKPKFRATFYQESDDSIKKTMSSNADFLTEHISKIISDNEAIVDVIETPLQKKYNKIKQIAESKQFLNEANDVKPNLPLNLTKQTEPQNLFRKRSHSESFSQFEHQKNLNPEGSIIKDLLLKTKANGCLSTVTSDTSDGSGHMYVCPLCQIIYRSADNLEIHRMYYCKGNGGNRASLKELKNTKPENVFMRSNSINVRLPETQSSPPMKGSIKLTSFRAKPDNLIIIKPETSDVVAPLPSPGPLLGNTRLVDSRAPDYVRRSESQRVKPLSSPKRRIENNSESYSPRLVDNMSPRSDLYMQPKLRCLENCSSLRSIDNISPLGRHHSQSLQMFGGEVKILDHSGSTTTLRIEPSKNQLSPIILHQSLSPSKLANDSEASSVVVRSGLHSGGTMVHNSPTPKELLGISHPQTPRVAISTVSNVPIIHDMTHFQFPPLSAITAYNPLTLPPLSPSSSPNGATTIMHGGKLIPHVPGIPGPNTGGLFMANSNAKTVVTGSELQKSNVQQHSDLPYPLSDTYPGTNVNHSKNITKFERIQKSRSPNMRSLQIDTDKISQISEKSETSQFIYSPVPIITVRNVDEPGFHKSFSPSIVKPLVARPENALKRSADGSPKNQVLKDNYPTKSKNKSISHIDKAIDNKTESNEIRNFNFENLITKAEIYGNQVANCTEVQKNTNVNDSADIKTYERSETAYFQKNNAAKAAPDDRKPKFLRPSTLPLKPGTFTPKRHHGITPNANTMPLVSPETPRPSKAYGQLYLNGNAYTYLGLKCSTKVFYCTINRPQPTYVPNQHFLSMYSNWQLLSELTPDPLGLSATSAMSLYDSRHRPQSIRVAAIKQDLILTHSSRWNQITKDNKEIFFSADKQLEENNVPFSESNSTAKKELAGGFESNEEYTYVRGRGRGRYVCSECGIRCKKPSMLKKHIRTHTDVRPYTCIHCSFSFKTKGNLTKHMKSKAHYKKCCELGINPNEGSNDMENADTAQCSGDTDDETDSDGDEGNEGETESSDTEACKSRLPEHEAAHCLLSLGGPRTATSSTPGLISARPSTYPYNPTGADSSSEPAMERQRRFRSSSVDSRTDPDDEPMDLSKAEVKVSTNISEIPTARESSVLASLASNTAKLPQSQTQGTFQNNGEPLLHTYLTERALHDSRIKQSQLAYGLNKKVDMEKSSFKDNLVYTDSSIKANKNLRTTPYSITVTKPICSIKSEMITNINVLKQDPVTDSNSQKPAYNPDVDAENKRNTRPPSRSNAENAKQVVSEYLKQAKINLSPEDNPPTLSDDVCDDNQSIKMTEDNSMDDGHSDTESIKMPTEHDPVARKVVVGAGGVAFKVSKGKDFDGGPSFSPSRLMEDGRRVCDFCNKTFTKPSQLRLHLNIHYMERPFRCSVCAVSFRTRGHLQKHERSGSHHNKVSMTSTFGAATSFNPRPFRCFDCNIAFRIHGHLAKHLRSKMHVMRLECLFKLPFGTFTEIERAGVSLTEIDTTDCASSLASLQSLARKLHEKDPTKLEYREPTDVPAPALAEAKDFPEEDDAINPTENVSDDYEKDNEKTNDNSECKEKESTYL